jgi:DNA repair protein RadC
MEDEFFEKFLKELGCPGKNGNGVFGSPARRNVSRKAPARPGPAFGSWSQELKPRERLASEGVEALSDRELIALLLNSGTKKKDVMTLASELLPVIDGNNGVPDVAELEKMTGLGKTKASMIAAMLEFGRRRWGIRGRRVNHPSEIFYIIRHYADYPQERFLTLSMNGAHEILATRVVTIGTANKTIIHPREVFADIIRDRSSAVCIAHNHPSGTAEPSRADDEVTRNLKEASVILGIHFLDHIIFTANEFYSYSLENRL